MSNTLRFRKSFGLVVPAVALIALTFIQPATAYGDDTENHVISSPSQSQTLTIYGNRYAQVEESRSVELEAGLNIIHVDGIAQQYRPDSFRLISVSDAANFTLQSVVYQPANLHKQNLLNESLGKHITVHRESGNVSGTLKAINGDELIVQTDAGTLEALSASHGVTFDNIPANLTNSASLVLEVQANKDSKHNLTFIYETGGVTYSVKHSVVLKEVPTLAASPSEGPGTLLSLDTSVSLANQSGTTFNNAKVYLISGSVVEEAPGGNFRSYKAVPRALNESAAMTADAAVETVGEQKQCTLPGTINLVNGQARQVPLLSVSDIPVEREYYAALTPYEIQQNQDRQDPASLRLRLTNDKAHGLNREIPAGPVKLYQYNSSQNLQLTASSHLDAKSPGEVFCIEAGSAPDIKIEAKLVSSENVANPNSNALPGGQRNPQIVRQKYKFVAHNYKKTQASVALEVEVQPGATLPDASQGFTRTSATKAVKKLNVAPAGEQTVELTTEQQY